jgi:hypothetical protein
MKRFQKITKGVLYALLCVVILSGCDGSKYDGLILTDTATGREYLLKHNILDTYFIDEKVVKIMGNDTTRVFE